MAKPNDFTDYEVAQKYWALPLEGRNLKKVAELLGCDKTDRNTQNQLGRLVRQAEARGLVDHQVRTDQPARSEYLPRVPSLEDKLRHRFGLRGVVVVDVSRLAPEEDFEKNPLAWYRYDDKIHEHLGRWARRVLMAVIRPTDIVGVGPGRGPAFTAEHCYASGNSAHYPKKVVSLTGQMTANLWDEDSRAEDEFSPSPRRLDADDIASLLALRLGMKVLPDRLDLPFASNQWSESVESNQARPVLKRLDAKVQPGRPGRAVPQVPNEEPAEADRVSLALCGLGALGGGHRFLRYSQYSDDLTPVADKLERLKGIAEKADGKTRGRGPFHHTLGDLCGFLFINDGPIARQHFQHHPVAFNREDLQDELDKLNERFLTTRPSALADIARQGGTIAVSGGPHKLDAIDHVLNWKENGKPLPLITHLVTDDGVARCLAERQPNLPPRT